MFNSFSLFFLSSNDIPNIVFLNENSSFFSLGDSESSSNKFVLLFNKFSFNSFGEISLK